MRFMSIYRPAQKTRGTAESENHMAEMAKFMEHLIRAGRLLSTGGLSNAGAAVRSEGGKLVVVDGPFAESKEMIAGWAILRGSKDEIVETTKSFLRVAGDGECELREIYELDDFPVDPAEKAGGWREKEQAFRADAQTPSPFLPPL